MNFSDNPIFRPNKLAAILFYAALQFIFGSFVIIIVAAIYCGSNPSLNVPELIMAIADLSLAEGEYIKAGAIVGAVSNLVIYVITTLGVCFYMRDYLKTDLLRIKENWLFYLITAVVSAGLLYGVNFGVSSLVDSLAGSSSNQDSIVYMLINGGALPLFFAVVVCAPLVEELIYRKAIFAFFEDKPIWLSYVISILAFVLPHMLTTTGVGVDKWLIISLPYVATALLLAIVYHFSKKNIYVTWFVHMINNLVAFLLIMLVV